MEDDKNAKVEVTIKFNVPYMGSKQEIDEYVESETGSNSLKNYLLILFREEGIIGIVDDEYEIVEVMVDGKVVE
jgi:hypothetical protein